MTILPGVQSGGRQWPRQTGALLPRCSFPAPGSAVVCAVSGGADSLAMLALAVASGCHAHAVYVDHGLRQLSGHDGDVVHAGADKLGASFEAVSVNVGPGPDLEARARKARYEVLPAGTLVGHTADDPACAPWVAAGVN